MRRPGAGTLAMSNPVRPMSNPSRSTATPLVPTAKPLRPNARPRPAWAAAMLLVLLVAMTPAAPPAAASQCVIDGTLSVCVPDWDCNSYRQQLLHEETTGRTAYYPASVCQDPSGDFCVKTTGAPIRCANRDVVGPAGAAAQQAIAQVQSLADGVLSNVCIDGVRPGAGCTVEVHSTLVSRVADLFVAKGAVRANHWVQVVRDEVRVYAASTYAAQDVWFAQVNGQPTDGALFYKDLPGLRLRYVREETVPVVGYSTFGFDQPSTAELWTARLTVVVNGNQLTSVPYYTVLQK